MRIFAAFIAESQTDFIDGFFVGKKISDMKDNRGNKMKDYILRQRLAEYDAKLDLVYRNFSEYVHLAEKAFYSSVTTSSSEQYDIEFSVGLPLKEKANPVLLEVANAFVYYVTAFLGCSFRRLRRTFAGTLTAATKRKPE